MKTGCLYRLIHIHTKPHPIPKSLSLAFVLTEKKILHRRCCISEKHKDICLTSDHQNISLPPPALVLWHTVKVLASKAFALHKETGTSVGNKVAKRYWQGELWSIWRSHLFFWSFFCTSSASRCRWLIMCPVRFKVISKFSLETPLLL